MPKPPLAFGLLTVGAPIPRLLNAVCCVPNGSSSFSSFFLLAPSLAGKSNSRYTLRHLARVLVGIGRRIAERVGYSTGRQSAGGDWGLRYSASRSGLGAANDCIGIASMMLPREAV